MLPDTPPAAAAAEPRGSARGPLPPRGDLPHAVAGERYELNGRSGRLSFYVAGSGPPLLLVHSVNAAASAYEVGPIFARQRTTRRVYAPDLPGFGYSDRSARRYDPRLYTDAIHDLLDEIARRDGAAPVDALAISLGAEFLARAAVERPERVRRLVLVTPTGFARGADRLRAAAGSTREVPGLHATVSFPLWGPALFNLLVSRPSIRFFLRKTFGRDDIDPAMIDYAYATAHQPGAANAPFAFLAGRLFSRDIRDVYEALRQPVWLAHGTKGDFSDFSESGWAMARPNWRVEPFPTGALPHFEEPDLFAAKLEAFLTEP
jgi:pimeloyl-ACP methyl ester carboxylesterase